MYVCMCVCSYMDLRYAKVTPGIANGYNSKQFLIRYVSSPYLIHPVM